MAHSSSPVFAQSLVALIKVYDLVGACGGRVPGFDEYAFVLKRFFSNDGSPDQVECVVGCETTESEKGFLILPSIGAFVFLHTRVEWPTGKN